MVRRKKPKITGDDPNYSHTFERFRPVESDMPPDVKIPGVNQSPAKPEHIDQSAKPKTEAAKPAVAATKPKASAKVDVKPKQKPEIAPAKPKASKPKPVSTNEPKTTDTPRGDRQITLDAAVKVTQAEAMKPLVEKGLQQRDIVLLAGRRATEKFVLSPTYLPKPEAERLPMQDGYHTSKRLDGAILDAMRDEHDPLRVRSDPAMVRGQFETLFWEMLDDVIAELHQKYN
ncbi:MAG: hypothetical protein AAFW87_08090 [Pseudomonadota bacterium]